MIIFENTILGKQVLKITSDQNRYYVEFQLKIWRKQLFRISKRTLLVGLWHLRNCWVWVYIILHDFLFIRLTLYHIRLLTLPLPLEKEPWKIFKDIIIKNIYICLTHFLVMQWWPLRWPLLHQAPVRPQLHWPRPHRNLLWRTRLLQLRQEFLLIYLIRIGKSQNH